MKHLKKTLQWAGIVLGFLLAIGLIANAWFIWTTDARLAAQWASIRAAGEPVTLADLARPPIPPEKNAATYLRQADADVKAIDDAIWAGDWWRKTNGQAFMTPLPLEGQKLIKTAWNAHPNVMPLFERAAACSEYNDNSVYVQWNPMPDKWLGELQVRRMRARTLHLLAWSLIADGKCDETLRTATLLLRLNHHFGYNEGLAGMLVAVTIQGIAIDMANAALQAGPVSQNLRNALDAALAAYDPIANTRQSLLSERPYYHELLAQSPWRNFWLVTRGVKNREESQWFDEVQSILPLLQPPVDFQRISKAYASKTLSPANNAMLNATLRIQATTRALRVLNALQTHVPAGGEAIPKLSELGLPAETTVDPFNGQPLIVKKLPNGWLVYSVSWNLKDDGGMVMDRCLDAGVGPPPAAKSSEKQP